MNVRVTWSTAPRRTVLYTSIVGISCDGKDHPGSGARRWLALDDGGRDAMEVPIGGRHGGIEIALDDDPGGGF